MMNSLLVALLCLLLSVPVSAGMAYSFGVLPQRSATLTAQYWNPILMYVGDKCGCLLYTSDAADE